MQNSNTKFLLQTDHHFDKSLQELRDLRSQLYRAAELYESTFFNAKDKKTVVENTKEYVCKAMVTLVDHLGCVSYNMDSLISKTNSFSEAHLRINCLNQRLALSEQFNHKVALNRLQGRTIVARHQPRYLSTPLKEDQDSRNSKRENIAPIFVYTYSNKAPPSKDQNNSSLLSHVENGFSITPKATNPSFHFQGTRTIHCTRRTRHGSDILDLIRRNKRTS